MTKMRERPILFNSEMVKAILEGRKTQTRRVIKPQPEDFDGDNILWKGRWKPLNVCPYGQVGDRLWVKETWTPDIFTGKPLWYKANGIPDSLKNIRWKPSIFMPRWASRITLEITGLRVERLQEITEEDTIKEGIVMNNRPFEGWYWMPNIYSTTNPIVAFEKLWDSLNAKREYSWEQNPWCWVLEFKRI